MDRSRQGLIEDDKSTENAEGRACNINKFVRVCYGRGPRATAWVEGHIFRRTKVWGVHISKLGSKCWPYPDSCSCPCILSCPVSWLCRGEGNVANQLLHPWRSLPIPAPPSTCSEISKQVLPPKKPRCLSNCYFYAVSLWGYLLYCLL